MKDLKFQLLVAALNNNIDSLINSMGIESDAIIINQCDEDKEEVTLVSEKTVKTIYQSGRGVGLSRNTAIDNAKADIVLFSDEDICYYQGYENKVLDAFASHADADVITFNVEVDERRRTYFNEDVHRITWKNYGRYPAYAIAVRLDAINKYNIRFSTLFGGGAKYSNGEDSLFLHDCLKAGLNMISETAILGKETYRESTWFKGYTDKFFFDRGVLYHFLYGAMAAVFGARFLIKNRNEMLKDISFLKAFGLLLKGIKEGKSL